MLFQSEDQYSTFQLFLATDMVCFITEAALVVDGDDQDNMPWGTPDPRNLKG